MHLCSTESNDSTIDDKMKYLTLMGGSTRQPTSVPTLKPTSRPTEVHCDPGYEFEPSHDENHVGPDCVKCGKEEYCNGDERSLR